MSMVKLSVGVGLISGPSIGSILYSLAGFKGPFLFFSVLFAILTGLVSSLVPDDVEDMHLADDSEERSLESSWIRLHHGIRTIE